MIDAERNPELFSNAGGIRPDQPGMPYMIDMDDPAHLLRRKLVNAGFTRKRVMDQGRRRSSTLCDTLIDAVCERGECDFVRDIAAPLPMAVIGDMLGVLPEERATAAEVVRRPGRRPELAPRRGDIAGGDGRVRRRTPRSHGRHRQAAGRADRRPVLASWCNAEVDGQRMSDDEIVIETLLILIGGDETTRHTLSGGTEQLLRHPDQWERAGGRSGACCPARSRRCCAGPRR